MRDARTLLLASATLLGWIAAGLAGSVSALPPWLVLCAVAASLAAWVRGWEAVTGFGVVVTVALLAAAQDPVIALSCGVLLLLHVTVLDLARHATGASARVVGVAVRRLVPGLLAGTAAGVVVTILSLTGGPGPAPTAVAVTAPWLLVVAVLVALGTATRRAFWAHLVRYGELSDTTKRYLKRTGLRL
ncbi:MAG: hypothetical protein M3P83_10095 [Actinomycetota bacterium]|nr:hypothetical protein [Actinomycetota bacterium]